MKFDAHLNPKVKAKWLNALRSRKFKQGKGELENYQKQLCCLGVLCKLQGIETYAGEGQSYIRDDDAAALFHCSLREAQNLQHHLGVRNDGGTDWDNPKPDGTHYRAPAKGLKFYQIARWIERNL